MKLIIGFCIFAGLLSACGSSGDRKSDSKGPASDLSEKKAALSRERWCLQTGSSANGFEYRQLVLNSNGEMELFYFEKMGADRIPSKLIKKERGTWSLEEPKLILNVASKVTVFSKTVVIQDHSGKALKLYDANDLFELAYSCSKSPESL